MTPRKHPQYAAQIRKSDGSTLLTRTVTDRAVPLFDDAMAAHDSLLTPPAELPAITAAIWADYISMGEIEVWRIRTNSAGYRTAQYIPTPEQPRTIVARAARADAFLATPTGKDFLRHAAVAGGFRTRGGLTIAEENAVHVESVEVLTGQKRCACGSSHTLTIKDAGI